MAILCVSEEFIQRMTDMGISQETIDAARQRNIRVHGPDGKCTCSTEVATPSALPHRTRLKMKLTHDV